MEVHDWPLFPLLHVHYTHFMYNHQYFMVKLYTRGITNYERTLIYQDGVQKNLIQG